MSFQFEITEDILEENNLTELYEYVVEFSNQFYADLELTTTEEEVEALLDYYWELCEDDEKIILWVNDLPVAENEDEDPPMTMRKYYDTWFSQNRK